MKDTFRLSSLQQLLLKHPRPKSLLNLKKNTLEDFNQWQHGEASWRKMKVKRAEDKAGKKGSNLGPRRVAVQDEC